MATESVSRRQRLRAFAESGNLRQALERAGLETDAVDLAVEVVLRYCAPPRRRRRKAEGR